MVVSWHWILLGLIGITAIAVALLVKPVEVWLRTTALILDLGTSYKWSIPAIPRRTVTSDVTYSCGNRDIVASLYRPDDRGRHPAIILAHGAIEGGKDDPALRLAGASLARAGYVTLVPQLDNLSKFRLHQDDVEALVAGFQYLSKQEFSNRRIGMMGVCLSAPLVLVAATDPDISRDIDVVTSWGGFYNINDWLQAVISEHYMDDGEAKPWRPRAALIEETPKWLIELSPDASDRVLLEEMLKGSITDSVRSRLSASGQALYELLTSCDPARVGDLWAKLDPQIRQKLDNLSPHLRVNQLQAKMAIIHTYTDDVIPWVESCKLADAIEDENKVYFRIFHQFYHVRLEDLLKVRISNIFGTVSEAVHFCLYIYHILYHL